MAWVSAPNNGKDGRLQVRPDAHAEATSELRDPLGSLGIYGEVPPKIAYGPTGTLYTAYVVTRVVPGERWPQTAMRFASSENGGAQWSAPTTVTATASGDSVFGSYNDHSLHVGRDGALFLSWLAIAGDSSYTYFVRSPDQGKSWSKPARIDMGAACPCCRTAMASAPDGSLYVAWRKIYPGGAGQKEIRDIAVARSNDGGATWTAPTRVHADEWRVNYCPDAGPSIQVADDGVVHIAWWTGKEGTAGVQYANSADRGASFSAPIPLGVAEFSRAAHVQLALGSGTTKGLVLAAWDDGTRRVSQIVARLSRDGGRSFGAAEPLSADGDPAGYPVVSLRGDTAMVAWQEKPASEAAKDSASHAHMDMSNAAAYVFPVGALRVMARSGIVHK